MKRFRLWLPVLLLMVGLQVMAGAQVLYSNTFEGAPVGAISDITTVSPSNFQVTAFPSTPCAEGVHGLVDTSPSDTRFAMVTAISTQADECMQFAEQIKISGSNIAAYSAMLRVSDTSATNGYFANCLWAGGSVSIYKKVGGANTLITSASVTGFTPTNDQWVVVKFEVQGTSLRFKTWLQGTAEPGSWLINTTDSTITAAGYAGWRESLQAGVNPTSIDELYVGNAGTTFSQPVNATGYVVSGTGTFATGVASNLTLLTSPQSTHPASSDTVTYSDTATPAGALSPLSQAVATTGATSFALTYTAASGASGSVTISGVSTNALTVAGYTTTIAAPPNTYLANNALIHYSPYEWHVSSASATEMETNTSGASFTISSSGSTTLTLGFDTNSPVTAGYSIRYTIDGGSASTATVAASVVVTLPNTSAHTVIVTVPSLSQSGDKWVTPSNVVRLSQVAVTAPGVLSTVTGLPTATALVYSDSRGGDNSGDGTASGIALIGQGLGYEVGNRSFGSEGWSTINATGTQAGKLTAFFTPGDDTNSSWNKYDSTHSLLTAGLLTPQPGAVIVQLGVNDQRVFSGVNNSSGFTAGTHSTDAQVTASVTGWLTAMRAACGGLGVATPTTIYVCLDYSGAKTAAITAGFSAYQTTTPDPYAKLALVPQIPGLTDAGTASYLSSDGVHPAAGYAMGLVASKSLAAIAATASGSSGRGRTLN